MESRSETYFIAKIFGGYFNGWQPHCIAAIAQEAQRFPTEEDAVKGVSEWSRGGPYQVLRVTFTLEPSGGGR